MCMLLDEFLTHVLVCVFSHLSDGSRPIGSDNVAKWSLLSMLL